MRELFYKKCLQVLIFVEVLSGRVKEMNPCMLERSEIELDLFLKLPCTFPFVAAV